MLYTYTFQGHPIGMNIWDAGPMNLEGNEYAMMAKGEFPLFGLGSWKSIRHPLCTVLYPIIYRPLIILFPVKNSPLVSSFLGSISIAIFGFWLYRRSEKALIVFPIVLLMGFSFSTWYVSSIWESRALILFSSVLLLVSIDGLIKKPSFPRILLVSAATVVMFLSCLANLYNMALVPVALLLLTRIRSSRKRKYPPGSNFIEKERKLRPRETIIFSLGYIGITLAVVVIIYQIFSFSNPALDLMGGQKSKGRVIEHCEGQLKRPGGADWNRFKDFDQIRTGTFESILYSVGGLRLLSNVEIFSGMGKGRWGRNEWKARDGYLSYGTHWSGRAFIIGYIILIITVLATAFRKKLFSQEPLLAVIIFWILLTTVIMIYVNVRTTAVFSIEIQPAIWAFSALTLARLKDKIAGFFLIAFVVVVAWNNFEVMNLFRNHYRQLARIPISSAVDIGQDFESNLIYAKKALISSSPENSGRGIENIIDNDPETFWQIGMTPAEYPPWIQVDFGKKPGRRIKYLAVRPRLDRPGEFFHSARIQAGNDGINWELVGNIEEEQPPMESNWQLWPLRRDSRFRYYRIIFLDGQGRENRSGPISISELGFY